MTDEKLKKAVSLKDRIQSIAIQVDTLKRCDTLIFTINSVSATVKVQERFMGEGEVFSDSTSQFCAKQKQEFINFLSEKISALEKEFAEL